MPECCGVHSHDDRVAQHRINRRLATDNFDEKITIAQVRPTNRELFSRSEEDFRNMKNVILPSDSFINASDLSVQGQLHRDFELAKMSEINTKLCHRISPVHLLRNDVPGMPREGSWDVVERQIRGVQTESKQELLRLF